MTGPLKGDFNNAFANVYGTDTFNVQGEVTVDKDNSARMIVRFNDKDYGITVGRHFVEGFANDEVKQLFAKELGSLLQTMHEHPEMKTGFVSNNKFSYNGNPLEFDKALEKTRTIPDKINALQEQIEELDRKKDDPTDGLATKVSQAEAEIKNQKPKRSLQSFGRKVHPRGKDAYDEAVKKHAQLRLELKENNAARNERNDQLKQLRKELGEYKAAHAFMRNFHHDPGGLAAVALPTPPLPPMPTPHAGLPRTPPDTTRTPPPPPLLPE